MLLDITLPYTGPYIIEVGPSDPFLPMNAGAYDLFVYRYTTIPEPNTAALLAMFTALVANARAARARSTKVNKTHVGAPM